MAKAPGKMPPAFLKKVMGKADAAKGAAPKGEPAKGGKGKKPLPFFMKKGTK